MAAIGYRFFGRGWWPTSSSGSPPAATPSSPTSRPPPPPPLPQRSRRRRGSKRSCWTTDGVVSMPMPTRTAASSGRAHSSGARRSSTGMSVSCLVTLIAAPPSILLLLTGRHWIEQAVREHVERRRRGATGRPRPGGLARHGQRHLRHLCPRVRNYQAIQQLESEFLAP